MKVILLAPGLSRVQRGYERFALELAAELRRAGLEAVCWGTSASAGVEALPVPGRTELQDAALAHLRSDPRFAQLGGSSLQDWSLYAEDQLFAVPAALRITQILEGGEQLLVYAKWQGGLVDPSGAPTELLKRLAAATKMAKSTLLIHADYIHAPIDSLLCTAGAAFHSLGPWISESLRQLGVMQDAIVELPMCIDGSAYKNCRSERQRVRSEIGVPGDAFTILSVGSFDTTTPDKRYGYLLQEILSLGAEDIFWVVAGSHGAGTPPWESEAVRQLGPRFIALPNVPFEKMPGLYGAADLFALGSVHETFGLAYLEAQFAGLPVIAHNSHVLRHLCDGLNPDQLALSLTDMQRKGAASASIARWKQLLTEDASRGAIRASLANFASAQERRFSWEFMGPRYAEEFLKMAPAGKRRSSVQHSASVGGWDDQCHQQAIRLFEEGKLADALPFAGRAIGGRETSERWNDWATIQVALHRPLEAEQGFRLALALDPRNALAATNLATILARQGRYAEAIPCLEQSADVADPALRGAVATLLEECRTRPGLAAYVNLRECADFLRKLPCFREADVCNSDELVRHLSALVTAIPNAKPGERLLCISPHGEYLAPAIEQFRGFRDIRRYSGRQAAHAKSDGQLQAGAAHFDIQSRPWPCAPDFFDFVLLDHALESAGADPMNLLCEINRALRTGGRLFLTARNLASAQSVHAVLEGNTPYTMAQFAAGAVRNAFFSSNCEYTLEEVECLANAAGFRFIRAQTKHVRWDPPGKVFPALAAGGYPLGSRGDTIFLLSEKESSVRDRFPAKLYDLSADHGRDASAAPEAPSSDARMRILLIYENPLRPDRGGEDHRLLQVLRLLRQSGHAVTFLSPRSFEKARYTNVLAELGIESFTDDAAVLQREGIDVVPRWTLASVLREGQFDLAIIPLWFWMCVSLPEHYVDEIRRLSPRTRVAILNDDCHGLRETRGAALSGRWSDRERAVDFHEREQEILRAADLSLCITDLDCRRFRDALPELDIDVLPMAVSSSASGPGFAAREGLMYLADYSNPASRDAIDWYLQEIAPIVRRDLPQAKLYLVGAGLPDELGTHDGGVVRVGFAADLAVEMAQRRILISPVRYGTGIKTKNLHAMSYGLPVVTTSVGAEGMDLESGKTALIADTAESFARAVSSLYTNQSLWESISAQGRSHIHDKFPEVRLASQLQKFLRRARALRPKRYDPDHEWPVRQVEKYFPEVTTHHPPAERPGLRVLAYIRSAEQLFANGRHAEARRQLRHVFSFVPARVALNSFFGGFTSMVESMERIYRALGDAQAASEFRREARIFVPWIFPESPATSPVPAKPPAQRHAKKRRDNLDFSVIVPTYNRQETLAECLEALNHQSFSPRRYEVIVIDDGSSDGTAETCKRIKSRYALRYFHQSNAGAGAARALGVDRARGAYLLLFNDDTIAHSNLLAAHLRAQRENAHARLAVLGDFRYPDAAKSGALLHFLSTEPFLFPQVTLQAGLHSKNAYFVASNLSVRRDAVIAAGSFDPRFRVAEDTELGVRLRREGFQTLYVPEARALHQHLAFTIGDLARRAEIYGHTQLLLFEKHPQLLGDGTSPFGRLDHASLQSIRDFIEKNRQPVADAVQSLAQFDSFDFLPFFSRLVGERTAAQEVMALFKRAVPTVFWYYLFVGFLAAWSDKQRHSVSGHERVLEAT